MTVSKIKIMINLNLQSHDSLLGIGSFAFLMIAMHNNVQEKIRKEVADVVGDGVIDKEAVVKLKYIDMVIRETIRLFPVGPALGRKVTGDLKLSMNFQIKFKPLCLLN